MNHKYNKFLKLTCVIFITVVTISISRADDTQPQAEILHWWVSEGESAALKVFIDAFKSRGGHYYDSSKYNEIANRKEAIERMGKGYPATLTQWNAGKDLVDLYDFGLVKPIRKQKIVKRLKSLLPAPVLDTVSRKGEIIAIPLNIHSENWLWYSVKHVGHSNVDLSGDWTEFLRLGEVLAKNDTPLLAVGNQPWQVRILFTSVFLGVSRDRYTDFYLTNEADVVDTDGFKTTLEVFNALAGYSKSFGDGNLNTQIGAVADNRAAANFMGDWARGEFISLGQKVGDDYGCQLTSTDDPSLLMAIDALVLGKVDEKSEIDGQDLMLDIVSDPAISLQFNALHCTAQVYAALSNEDAIIPPYHSYFAGAGEYAELVDRAIYEFWIASQQMDTNSSELIERTREKFRAILKRKSNRTTQTAIVED